MNTFYLKETGWTPKEPFWAIKHKGELHPCTYQSDAERGKYECHIYGHGWKKSKKAYKVPLCKGDFNEYLKEYGKNCLFYSITGKDLDSSDCVVTHSRLEFLSFLDFGIEYMESFISEIKAVNEEIKKTMKEKFGYGYSRFEKINNGRYIGEYDAFFLRPRYSIICSYFRTAPHIDPVNDDERLWKHFVCFYGIEKEDLFPVSVKDRLSFLFNKEVSERYEKILNNYPMTKNSTAF